MPVADERTDETKFIGPLPALPWVQKVVHKADETTWEFKGNEIVNKIVKPKPVPDANSGNVEEIIIPLDKWQEILEELRQVLQNGTP